MIETALAIPPGTYLALIAASFVLNLTPGADMMFTIASALRGGAKAGLAAGWGISLGLLCHVLMAAIGLAALMAAHPGLLSLVRYLGAAYLLWLAWRTWHDTAAQARTGRSQFGAAFARGFVTNLFNPKVALFTLAFLPQFADASLGPPALQILVLGGVMVLVGLVNNSLIGLAAGALSLRIQRHGQALNRASALIFGGLAARLAWPA